MKPAQKIIKKRGQKKNNKVANCPNCHREINTCSKTAASSRKRWRVNIHRNTEAEVLKSRHSGVKGLHAEGDDDLSSWSNQRLCEGPSRLPTHRLHLPVSPRASWRLCRPLTWRLKRLIVTPPAPRPLPPPHPRTLETSQLVGGTRRRHAEGGCPLYGDKAGPRILRVRMILRCQWCQGEI